MEKINIAELLKNCPSGMELDCTMYENLELERINKDDAVHPIICRVKTERGSYSFHSFTKYGCYSTEKYSKCVIFPKGKTTWEGFQIPFKDGDIIYTDNFIAILSHITERGTVWYHCYYCICTKNFKAKRDFGIGNINYDEFRIATADEKAKLFQVIKDNGYKWNPETKTLEKVPKIKDGDIIYTKTSLSEWVSIFEKFDDDECKCYIDYCIDSDTYCGKIGGKKNPLCDIDEIVEQRLATEEEKQKLFKAIKENGYKWNEETKTLEKLIKPKFKVGDKVRHKSTNKDDIYEISKVYDDSYGLVDFTWMIYMKYQDQYELVPNKFDITTLKPFDKVLTRANDDDSWVCNLYSHRIKDYYVVLNAELALQCIPFEQNKHLLGTTNDCEEFYKTWK